ncbi:ABC-three component system protein [Streptomyces niveus]|uniref:ABC-three component system protein n=1 Tax=Streptomyces niveus TaxID=193462 RepID=UPI00368FA11A
MGGAKEPPRYQADPLFTDLPQPSHRAPGYYAEPLFTELPHQADQTSTGAVEAPFHELPKPSPGATALSPVAFGPHSLTPKQYIATYSPEQWEEFVLEWVLGLKKENYVGVVGLGGAYDHGADVAAFLTRRKTDGPWHCYQCKHYKSPLRPATAYPEMFKIIWAVAEKKYRVFPERYCFVAPMIGTTLEQLLVKPEKLREEFLLWVTKHTNRLADDYGKDAFRRTLALARRTDFSRFEAPTLEQILEQHAKSRYHVARFSTPLPPRPPKVPLPAELAAHESLYVQKLLAVYEEKFGCLRTRPEQAQAHPTAKGNLQRQREAFYRAEQLRTFCRDSVPPGTFATLQQAFYSGVKEVEEDDFETGWERLKAVLAAARDMQLARNQLFDTVEPEDRHGICHQLANDDDEDQLTWVRKGV